ncbi:MAG: recombination regulator RecX [Saezia sp.]
MDIDEKTSKRSIRVKLLSMLASREYSRHEMKQKASAWLMRQKRLHAKDSDEESREASDEGAANELSQILDEFEAKGWLSDARYVESLINQKAHRLGTGRLKQELKVKGIHEDLAQEALAKMEASESERAYEVWERKFKAPPTDPKSYQKQMRFLLYRGFSIDAIKKILRDSGRDDL